MHIVYLVPVASSVEGVMVSVLLLMVLVVGIVVPMLFWRSIHPLPFLMFSLKETMITLFLAMSAALLAGSVVVMVGEVPTLNVLVLAATGFPAWSVIDPVCIAIVYLLSVKGLVGVMVSILSFKDKVVGITVPLLFLRSIHMVPSFISSLKVIVIILSGATFTALFAGSVESIVGATVSMVTEVGTDCLSSIAFILAIPSTLPAWRVAAATPFTVDRGLLMVPRVVVKVTGIPSITWPMTGFPLES